MVIEIDKRRNRKKSLSSQDVHQLLAERNACFVLITCGEPTEDGKMEVEMIYEGDVSLVAYLIEGAQGLIENQNESS
jgi:hypothetical protein